MKLRNLFRPFYLAGRLQNWLYEKRHPDHPWLAPDAIVWLEKHLSAEMKGFEWGSGRSTLWVGKRIGQLTSIESDAEWYAQVSSQLKTEGLPHIELKHVALEHAAAETYALQYDPLPANAAAILLFPDESLDLVIVDGWYRPVCALAALDKIKPGGYLLIDNTNWDDPPHVHVPAHWPLVHRSRNVMTETSVWRRPS